MRELLPDCCCAVIMSSLYKMQVFNECLISLPLVVKLTVTCKQINDECLKLVCSCIIKELISQEIQSKLVDCEVINNFLFGSVL